MKKMTLLCAFLLGLVPHTFTYAQDVSSEETLESSKDSNWWLRPKEKWAVKTGIQSRQVYLTIPDSSNFNNSELRYDAATRQSYFVGAEKNGIGGSLTLDSLFKNGSEPSYKDYRFYKHEPRWSAEVSWLQYKGFKLNSSNIANVSARTKNRDDISFESFRLGGMWNFFPERLSLPSVLQGAGIQKKSAGTIFLTGAISQSRLSSDLGLIPYPNDTPGCCQYKNDLDILSGAVGVMGIYNFVLWEKWVAGVGYGFELGVEKVKQSLNDDDSSQSFANNRYMLNFGYQGKDWFALIYFLENTQQVKLTQIDSMKIGTMETNFTLGYYF